MGQAGKAIPLAIHMIEAADKEGLCSKVCNSTILRNMIHSVCII
jgi:hypothetical protein